LVIVAAARVVESHDPRRRLAQADVRQLEQGRIVRQLDRALVQEQDERLGEPRRSG
jgi:hypothetical protein